MIDKQARRGLLKFALNLNEARKATSLIKKYVIKKVKTPTGYGFRRGLNVGPVIDASTLNIYMKGDSLKPALETVIQKERFFLDKKLFSKSLENFSKENREMVNRVFLMHEGAERNVLKKLPTSRWIGIHSDPKVILQESNMIGALSKNKFQSTQNLFSRLRLLDKTKSVLESSLPQFEYGKVRYSRHAIKRFSEILMKKDMGVWSVKNK